MLSLYISIPVFVGVYLMEFSDRCNRQGPVTGDLHSMWRIGDEESNHKYIMCKPSMNGSCQEADKVLDTYLEKKHGNKHVCIPSGDTKIMLAPVAYKEKRDTNRVISTGFKISDMDCISNKDLTAPKRGAFTPPSIYGRNFPISWWFRPSKDEVRNKRDILVCGGAAMGVGISPVVTFCNTGGLEDNLHQYVEEQATKSNKRIQEVRDTVKDDYSKLNHLMTDAEAQRNRTTKNLFVLREDLIELDRGLTTFIANESANWDSLDEYIVETRRAIQLNALISDAQDIMISLQLSLTHMITTFRMNSISDCRSPGDDISGDMVSVVNSMVSKARSYHLETKMLISDVHSTITHLSGWATQTNNLLGSTLRLEEDGIHTANRSFSNENKLLAKLNTDYYQTMATIVDNLTAEHKRPPMLWIMKVVEGGVLIGTSVAMFCKPNYHRWILLVGFFTSGMLNLIEGLVLFIASF